MVAPHHSANFGLTGRSLRSNVAVMRKTIWLLFTLIVLIVLATILGRAQAPAGRPAQPSAAPPAGRGAPPAPVAVFKLEDNFLQWRLLPSEKQYEAIDGKRLMETVRAVTSNSR